MKPLQGIHHITAISGSAHRNYRFYTTVLGMRMVKKTVNFDDPATYHLYYGNEQADPGTLLTFFPWEGSAAGRQGAGQVGRIYLKAERGSLEAWRQRLRDHQVAFRESERGLEFHDDEGMRLGLVESDEPGSGGFWGLELLVSDSASMAAVLEKMGARRVQDGHYQMGPHHFLLVVDPQRGSSGAGTIHHLAFRLPDEDSHRQWQGLAASWGWGATPVIDRNYFKAFYFRTRQGILFEVSSDTPGFAIDEPLEVLGQRLQLPPQYEAHRARIESILPPLEVPYHYLRQLRDPKEWVLALHGTGGDEHDLVPLISRVHGRASLLSPRGNVPEQGMARFFRRLAPGVLDETDVARRAQEMEEFVRGQLPVGARLTALGYSNGANLAAAMLLLGSRQLAGAALLRPMLPLQPERLPDLSEKEVLLIRALQDPVIPAASTDRLIHTLQQAGARLQVHELPGGHELGAADQEILRAWFETRSLSLTA